LIGNDGADSIFGLAGNDTISARDGLADSRISCGETSGVTDTVTADTSDPADSDCETVNRG